MVQCDFHWWWRVFKKEFYNGNPNGIVWLVLQKRLHLKAYKLSIFQGVEHSPRSNVWNAILKLFLKQPV
jgi:hypothetical protein